MVYTFTDFDKAKSKAKSKKNCKKGMPCGFGCISKTKKCKKQISGGGGGYADHVSDPDNLEKGAESSGVSGTETAKDATANTANTGIETAKDAIAKGEQFLKDELDELDKLNANLEQARAKELEAFKSAMTKGGTPEELQKAGLEVRQNIQKAENAVEEHFDKIYEKIVSGDLEKGSELARNLRLANGAPAYSKDIRENASDLFTMSNGKGGESLKVIVKAKDRAYAMKDTDYGGLINIGGNPSDRRVLFHEMAHHIEYENPKYASAAKDFILSRATDKEKPLKEITGNPSYRDDEIAFPDKFITPYVGKVYESGTTEVLSIGVEKMANRETAKEFMQADREHFMFVVGVLKD